MSVVACDQDEVTPDPTTGIGDVNDVTKLSLYELEIQVQTPEAMENVEDAHAAMAVGYVESINSFSAFSTFFLPPEGATKRNTPINASNARVTTSKICCSQFPFVFGGK